MSTGDRTDDQDRILSGEELDRIDRNLFLLVDVLDVHNTRLLDSLVRDRCITERHRNRIKSKLIKEEWNEELLSIIRRRSYSNFTTLIDALKRRKQNKAVRFLEQQTGRFGLLSMIRRWSDSELVVIVTLAWTSYYYVVQKNLRHRTGLISGFRTFFENRPIRKSAHEKCPK